MFPNIWPVANYRCKTYHTNNSIRLNTIYDNSMLYRCNLAEFASKISLYVKCGLLLNTACHTIWFDNMATFWIVLLQMAPKRLFSSLWPHVCVSVEDTFYRLAIIDLAPAMLIDIVNVWAAWDGLQYIWRSL